MEPLISAKDLKKNFGHVEALKGVSLDVAEGEKVVVIGPSGSGKSVLIRCMNALERPDSGELTVDGMDLMARKVDSRALASRVAMVFQGYNLYPHKTVLENVTFAPEKVLKVPAAEAKARALEYLERVGLTSKLDKYPDQLSGGQQQRVAIARAVASNPKLLLLDEPLSNLDAKLRESMRFEIKEIQKNFGISVVYVTHDQSEAMAMSDRVIVINRGVIQQIGTPIEIYRNPANQFVADFLGKINFIKGEVKNGRIELTGLGQSLPYDGPRTGKVVVAVRPENIDLSLDSGDLEGRISSMFYMGDVNDCRVDINGVQVRVIADSHSYDKLYGNEKIYLRVQEFLVYEDDGSDEHTKIVT